MNNLITSKRKVDSISKRKMIEYVQISSTEYSVKVNAVMTKEKREKPESSAETLAAVIRERKGEQRSKRVCGEAYFEFYSTENVDVITIFHDVNALRNEIHEFT